MATLKRKAPTEAGRVANREAERRRQELDPRYPWQIVALDIGRLLRTGTRR